MLTRAGQVGFSTQRTPARISHALKKRRRMSVDEMHVPADGFVEQFENALARMLARHGCERVGEVLDEREDHGLKLLRGFRLPLRAATSAIEIGHPPRIPLPSEHRQAEPREHSDNGASA